jgi:predicted TIM-barrel fold metal-dependent hydrolase
MPKCRAQEILDKKGADWILFGCDCPWHSPSWDVRMIETLDISESDKEKIYHLNAEKLLNS